jgi:hypothetical protein
MTWDDLLAHCPSYQAVVGKLPKKNRPAAAGAG